MKQHFYNTGYISTEPTEEGVKVLDVFHPSYRVKRINQQPLVQFENDDIMLDIVQNEKRNLIKVTIDISKESMAHFFNNLQEKYNPPDYPENQKKIYNEMLRILLEEHLIPEMRKEIKEELIDNAENFVISQC